MTAKLVPNQEKVTSVAVIAGQMHDIFQLDVLCKIPTSKFNITIVILAEGQSMGFYDSPLKVQKFEEVKDMPGYIRGLEEHLKSYDLLVCCESSRLASFQCLRAGLKFKIPVILWESETKPFQYLQHKNISAIQKDLFENSSLIISSSIECKDRLLFERVDAKKIITIPASASSDRFRFEEKRREKFLTYLQFKSSTILITYHFSTESDLTGRFQDFINALTLIKRSLPKSFSRVRIIFLSNTQDTKQLKHLVYNSGLSENARFLQQDFRGFCKDLFSATDILIFNDLVDSDSVKSFPRWILDAMLCCTIPVVYKNSCAASIVGKSGILLDESVQSLTNHLKPLIEHDAFRESMKTDAQSWALKHNACDNAAKKLAFAFSDCIQNSLTCETSSKVGRSLESIKELLETQKFQDVVIKCEDYLLRVSDSLSPDIEVLHTLKGQALLGLRDFNAATNSFDQVLQRNKKSIPALLGLGTISLESFSYDDAVRFFKRVITIDPQNYEAKLGLGMAFRSLDLNHDAIFWLRSCLNEPTWSKSALIALVQILRTLEDVPEAIKILEDVRESTGENPTLMICLGTLYLKSGMDEIGNKLLSQAIEKD